LSKKRVKAYAQAIHDAGSLTDSCFGFVDGHFHGICRPGGHTLYQESMYNGSKKSHGLNFQAITGPDGMFLSLSSPFPGRTHDMRIWREFDTEGRLERTVFPDDDAVFGKHYHYYLVTKAIRGEQAGYSTLSWETILAPNKRSTIFKCHDFECLLKIALGNW
jgi:hypothetical protein